jgi:hypothetical protein
VTYLYAGKHRSRAKFFNDFYARASRKGRPVFVDHSSKRVDIASNGVRSLDVDAELVPDLEEALGKCQWWQR